MSVFRSWSRILLSLVVASTAFTALILGGSEVTASASPPKDVPYQGTTLDDCDFHSSTISATCLSGALEAFSAARKKQGLNVNMVLPSNFRSMSVPMQMLTLTNVDRRDRGLPVFASLSANLNPYTQSAANQNRDPNFPRWTRAGGANWAGVRNSLWAEYLWMYDDGLRSDGTSANGDCSEANQAGCWSHRNNILSTVYGAPRILGASVSTVNGVYGIATLMMGMDTHDWYPNPVRNLAVRQLAGRHIRATWSAPAPNGPAVKGYYVKRDSRAWVKLVGGVWTSPSLAPGSHSVSVKSFNARGSSPIRTVHIRVR